MPIIDILGGVLGGSNSSSSGSNTSTSQSGLTSLANGIFPGLGNVLSNLLGDIKCWGKQSMTNATYNEWMGYATNLVNGIANGWTTQLVQSEINQWAYVVDRWQNVDYPKLKNPCSKEICKKCIKLLLTTRDAIFAVYNVSEPHQINMHGVNVMTRTLISRKNDTIVSTPTYPPVTYPPTIPPVTTTPPSYPPVTYPPTTPPVVTPPVNYPPVTYPDTTTPPVYNPPVTYPDTTTPPVYNPPVTTTPTGNTTNASGGITRTQTVHADGSMTIYLWNPDGTLYKTINIPAPNVGGSSMTSNLDGNIDINGNIGDWNFGLNNNKDQTLYIAGGLGLLGLIAYMAKSKK